jgi:membrane protein EpsK
MALPIGLICGFSRPLLGTWLGQDFESLAPLMILLTAHLCLNLAVLPLFNIQVATGNVRWPGLVTCLMGGANLALALLLAGPCKWGFYGVAAAGAITLTLKNLVFTPLYCAHLLELRWHTFLKETLPVTAATLALSAAAAGTTSWLQLRGWRDLILAGAIVALAWAAFAYLCLLSRAERAKIRELISSGLGSPASPVVAARVDEVCTRK